MRRSGPAQTLIRAASCLGRAWNETCLKPNLCGMNIEANRSDQKAMRIILPNCRVQFTAEDVGFVIESLGKKEGDRQSLDRLMSDPDSLDAILDNEQILRVLLENPGFVRVSAHFYFYALVRRVLRQEGIDDRAVADYLAELLVEFSQTERNRCQLPGHPGSLDYFYEMLAALRDADERTNFYLRSHIGNRSLFMSGLFPEHIARRAGRRGAPGLSYYQELGRVNFRVAGDHRLARKYELSRVFHTLAECFEAARRALHDLAERLVSLGDPAFKILSPDAGPELV